MKCSVSIWDDCKSLTILQISCNPIWEQLIPEQNKANIGFFPLFGWYLPPLPLHNTVLLTKRYRRAFAILFHIYSNTSEVNVCVCLFSSPVHFVLLHSVLLPSPCVYSPDVVQRLFCKQITAQIKLFGANPFIATEWIMQRLLVEAGNARRGFFRCRWG